MSVPDSTSVDVTVSATPQDVDFASHSTSNARYNNNIFWNGLRNVVALTITNIKSINQMAESFAQFGTYGTKKDVIATYISQRQEKSEAASPKVKAVADKVFEAVKRAVPTLVEKEPTVPKFFELGNVADQFLLSICRTMTVPGFIQLMEIQAPEAIDDFIKADIKVIDKVYPENKAAEKKSDKDESKKEEGAK